MVKIGDTVKFPSEIDPGRDRYGKVVAVRVNYGNEVFVEAEMPDGENILLSNFMVVAHPRRGTRGVRTHIRRSKKPFVDVTRGYY